MSNETDKPLAGALRAARAMLSADHQNEHHNSLTCGRCRFYAGTIVRESGLAELVEAVRQANPIARRVGDEMLVTVSPAAWNRIVAAARRVREG